MTTRNLLSYENLFERGQIVSNAGGSCHQQNARARAKTHGNFCAQRSTIDANEFSQAAKSIQELEVLADEIATDILRIGVDQLLGDRSRCLAVAHARAVEALHRQDAEAGRGE